MNTFFTIHESDLKTGIIGINLGYFDTQERAINYIKDFTNKYREFDCRFTLTSGIIRDDSTTDEDIVDFFMRKRVYNVLYWDYEKKSLIGKYGETY